MLSSYNNSFQNFIGDGGKHTLIIINSQSAVYIGERCWDRSEEYTQGNIYILKI